MTDKEMISGIVNEIDRINKRLDLIEDLQVHARTSIMSKLYPVQSEQSKVWWNKVRGLQNENL